MTTPYERAELACAFTLAAKKDDREEMRHLLNEQAEHLSPITAGVLFFAFNEALREDRMETATFLLQETPLARMVSINKLEAQATHHGRCLSIKKAA